MTVDEFTTLSIADRMVHVVDHGAFLAEDEPGSSNFYDLGDFYVEVVLDVEAGRIVELHAFVTGERYERMLLLRSGGGVTA